MDLEQLSIFDLPPADNFNKDEIVPYEIEERVSILLNVTEEEDSFSYYYLKDFQGKRGVVKKVILQPRLQYEILFGDRVACVYHEEITI